MTQRLAARLAQTLIFAIFVASLVTTLAVSFGNGLYAERKEHGTLDAASQSIRAALRQNAEQDIATGLARLHGDLATWGLSAAAFDRDGVWRGGDPDLRNDGLPQGKAAALRGGRQIAVVEGRSGYVLLVPDPRIVRGDEERAALFGASVVALVTLVSIPLARRWARRRAAPISRVAEQLSAIATGGDPREIVASDSDLRDFVNAYNGAAARFAQVRDSGAGAEERLRSFLAEAGHELRTPLAIATGYVEILQRGGADGALLQRVLTDVAAEHARLRILVERILQLAKLDSLPAEENARARVADIVTQAVALVRPLAPERQIEIRVEGALWVATSPDELRDVLRNVLDNAVRYSQLGSISIETSRADGNVEIRVVDGGPGMTAFEAQHAFDRFFRGGGRGETTGSGLGLSIVRRIVERSGGYVDLRSANSGTRVSVFLPHAKETIVPEPEPSGDD